LTACVLIIPPFSELKENVYSIIDFLQVWWFLIKVLWFIYCHQW
jgi:hypothetical protein